MNQKQFFKKFSGYAMTAAAALGMPHQVILAQWAHESAYGGSSLARRAKNYAGIKYNENADFKSGSYAGYDSITSFVSDYVRVMRLSYYAEVRQASGIDETVEALANSPYAGDSDYGDKLRSMIKNNDVTATTGSNIFAGLGNVVNWVLMNPFVWIGALAYFMLTKTK